MDWQDFHFLRPYWFILLIPFAWLLYRLLKQRSSTSAWQHVCDTHLLPHLLIQQGRKNKPWPLLFLVLGWLLAIIAIAGPVWSKLPQPVFRAQLAQILILDLSRSMDANDIQPSRLSRAKFKVLDILKRHKEGQTGLVVFAGEPFVVAPLTDDAQTIAAMIPPLATYLMPSQGSRVDLALKQASELLKQSGLQSGNIILITDGMGDSKATLSTAQQLRQQGIRISVLAVGTSQGAPISLDSGGFLKDKQGSIVIPQVDMNALRALAKQGGGQFQTLTVNDHDLQRLLDINFRQRILDDSERALRNTDTWREEGPWLLLLVVPLAALVFRRGWLSVILLFALIPPRPSLAFEWDNLWKNANQQGILALQQKKPEEAAQLFNDPMWQGTALYKAGQYEQAASAFAKGDTPEAQYNLGNALAKQGKLEDALAAFNRALKSNPQHQDALYNRRLIENLNQQQNQTDESPQENSDKNKSEEKEQNAQNQQQGNQRNNTEESSSASQSNNDQTSSEKQAQNTKQNTPSDPSSQNKAQRSQDLGEQKKASTETNNADSTPPNAGTQQGEETNQAITKELDTQQSESQQALEQWLRRIPDDPGGLLRRKFLRDRQRQHVNTSDDLNPW